MRGPHLFMLLPLLVLVAACSSSSAASTTSTLLVPRRRGFGNNYSKRHHRHHTGTASANNNNNDKTNQAVVALQIRGGAGPLDLETLVKATTILYAAGAVLMHASPEFANRLCGIPKKDNDALSQWGQSGNGGMFLCFAAMLYCTVFEKTPIAKAFQAATVIILYEKTRFLTGTLKRLGCQDLTPLWIIYAWDYLTVWALNTSEYADLAIKSKAVLYAVLFLNMVLAPDMFMKQLKLDRDLRPVDKTFMYIHGFATLALGVLPGAIVWKGATPIEAAGYCSALLAVMNGTGIMSGMWKQSGIPNGFMLVWMLYNLVVVGTTLF